MMMKNNIFNIFLKSNSTYTNEMILAFASCGMEQKFPTMHNANFICTARNNLPQTQCLFV